MRVQNFRQTVDLVEQQMESGYQRIMRTGNDILGLPSPTISPLSSVSTPSTSSFDRIAQEGRQAFNTAGMIAEDALSGYQRFREQQQRTEDEQQMERYNRLMMGMEDPKEQSFMMML